MSASQANTLDLRQITAPERSALLLNRFADLLPGQSLELICDQDTVLLRDPLQIRAPGLFTWQMLEQGPQLWRTHVAKRAPDTLAVAGSCCSGGACCG